MIQKKPLSNFTLVLQGPVDKFTEYIIAAAEDCDRISSIIVSHWDYDTYTIYKTPKVIEIVNEDQTTGWGKANINRHALSTMVGLSGVQTPYAIKLRANNWPYTKLDNIIDKFTLNPDKVLVSNFFFRRHEVHPFHPSDHLFVAPTHILKEAFKNVFKRCITNDIERPYYKLGSSPAVEQVICDEILHARGTTSRTKQDMIDTFEIIPITEACDMDLLDDIRRNAYINDVPFHATYNVVNNINDL